MMKDDILLEGTKEEISNDLIGGLVRLKEADEINIFRELVSNAIDFIEENQEKLLTIDEEFQMDNLRNYEGRQGLMAADADYFIGIKKGILILSFVVGKILMYRTDSALENLLLGFLEELFPKEDMAFFKKLDKVMGESCIVLESAKNRENGIDVNYFSKFKGECIHYDFGCRLCQDGRCGCNGEKFLEICKKLCEEHVLKERNGRYFYTDIF